MAPPLTLRALREDFDDMVQDANNAIYYSIDWSEEFYVTQATKGFIAVAIDLRPNLPLLLPELQHAYAVLRHDRLHVSKKVRKRAKKFRIALDTRLDQVLDGIEKAHDSWIIQPYKELIQRLHKPSPVDGKQLRMRSIELIDPMGNLAAGEVGYTIGAVYTSLSGFVGKHDAQHKGAGTVQLVALSRLLCESGYHFLALGHPPRPATAEMEACMMYKAVRSHFPIHS